MRAALRGMENQRIPITLAHLNLNQNNDRHGPLDSQYACIDWMMQNLEKEILRLAEDIAKNGLSRLENIMVLPSDDNSEDYVVWEGNRRITALKLLDDPKRAPSDRLRKRFAKIRGDADVPIPTEIECEIADSPEEVDLEVARRHEGQQGGVGVLPWNAAQSSRHAQRVSGTGRYQWTHEVLDGYADLLDPDLRDTMYDTGSKFPISTLDRLLKNKDVRDFLGLAFGDDGVRRTIRREETAKGLNRIVSDLARKEKTVSDFYKNSAQKAYIDDFAEADTPNTDTPLAMPKKLTDKRDPKPGLGKPGKKKPRPRQHRHDRKRLIASDQTLKIDDKRVNSVYHELRKLVLSDHPNAVSVLMRVFVELSTDIYLNFHSISLHQNAKLRDKLQSAAKHLVDNGWATKSETKGARNAASNPNSALSINSFNAWVHDRNSHPPKPDLIDAWDNLFPYLRAINDH